MKLASQNASKRDAVYNKMETLVEKQSLIELAQEHIQLSELSKLVADSTPAPVTKTSTAKSNAYNVPDNFASPTPEQLRTQASMIRKNPELVRRSQPMFANMSDDQIRAYADQIEQVWDRNYY